MFEIEGPIYAHSNTTPSKAVILGLREGDKLYPLLQYSSSVGRLGFQPFDFDGERFIRSLKATIQDVFALKVSVFRCMALLPTQRANARPEVILETLLGDDSGGFSLTMEKVTDKDIASDLPGRQEVLARGLWLLTITRNPQ